MKFMSNLGKQIYTLKIINSNVNFSCGGFGIFYATKKQFLRFADSVAELAEELRNPKK